MRSSAVAAAALVALAASACARTSGPTPERPARRVLSGPMAGAGGAAFRFIADEPDSRFDPMAVSRARAVASFALDSGAEARAWTVSHGRVEAGERGGLGLLATTEDLYLTRPVELEAEAVCRVEAVLRSAFPTPKLFWAGPEPGFSEERQVMGAPVESPGSDGLVRYAFDVARHPRWSGRVAGLRLDPTSVEGDRVVLARVEALACEPDPERLASAAEKAWKVELAHERRNALLVPPGLGHERELVVEGAAELRFEYGSLRLRGPGPGEAGELRVAVERAGGGPETLLSLTAQEDRWTPARVSLARFAGARVRLRLQNVSRGPRRGLLVAANPELAIPGQDRRPNLVLISADSLGASHLSLYGGARTTSPNIDAWARRRGIVFRNAVAAATWTLPSHVSLLSGRDAAAHGVLHRWQRIPPEVPLLPELLRRAGYRTLALTGGGLMHPDFGFGRGFDRYRYWAEPREAGAAELESHAEIALGWLRERPDRPLFLLFHTYELHAPYRAREPYFSRLRASSKEPPRGPKPEALWQAPYDTWREAETGQRRPVAGSEAELQARYDSAVAHLDAKLGRLLDAIEKGGSARPTIVVLTADHGEMLGERGLAEHHLLYDEVLRVPLVLAAPGLGREGASVEAQVRSVDVAPTLLELLGLEVPPATDGASLVGVARGDDREDRPAWAYDEQFGLALRVARRWKYVNTRDPSRRPGRGEALFDLSRDPGERDAQGAAGPWEPMRRRALLYLEDKPAGLRIELAGGETEPLVLELSSADLIRSVGVPCACAQRLPGGRISLSLGKRGRTVLRLEGALPGSLLRLEPKTPGGPRFDLGVEPGGTPRTLRWGAGRWSWADGPRDPAGPFVRLAWTGSLPPPRSEDPELRERLRALGYLR